MRSLLYKISGRACLKKGKGFTLIELMLVVLIVSLLSVYAVKIINTNLINNQVSRAVSQITAIQQALTNYYAKNAQWPDSLNTLTATGSAYLPNGATSLCSPFITATNTASCGQYAAYNGNLPAAGQDYYRLSITLPSADMTNQLLANLSNSWAGTQSNTINIAVLPPAYITPPNHGWIVSAGSISFLSSTDGAGGHPLNPNNYYSTGTKVYLPGNCPAGYEGHIFFSPQYYETEAVLKLKYGAPPNSQIPYDNGQYGELINMMQAVAKSSSTGFPGSHIALQETGTTMLFLQNSIINNLLSMSTGITNTSYGGVYDPLGPISQDNRQHTAYGFMTADVPDLSFDLNTAYPGTPYQEHLAENAFYLTMCLPVNHWGNNFLWAMWPQDGQCSSSWINYLSNNTGARPLQCNSGSNSPAGNVNLYDCSANPYNPSQVPKGSKSCTMEAGPPEESGQYQATAY